MEQKELYKQQHLEMLRKEKLIARSLSYDKRRRGVYEIQRGLDKRGIANYQLLKRVARSVPAVGICINIIKERITKTPWTIKNKNSEVNRDEDIKYITQLLKRPNENETFRSLLDKILEDLLIYDAVAIEKVRNAYGQVKKLYYVDASTIKPVFDEKGNNDIPVLIRDKSGNVFEDYISYVQTIDTGTNISDIVAYWNRKDLIYFNMHPQGSIDEFGYGKSPLERIIGLIGILLTLDNFNASYFEEGNYPPQIIQIMGGMKEKEFEGFREYLISELEGSFNRPAIVATDKEIRNISLKDSNLRDMQFSQYYTLLLKLVASSFGLSFQDLGITDDLNRATSEVQESLTKTRVYGSILQLIKEQIDMQLIYEELGTEDIEFEWIDTDDLPIEQAIGIYKTALESGIMTLNEVRKAIGKEEFGEWANIPMILTSGGFSKIFEIDTLEEVHNAKNIKEISKEEIVENAEEKGGATTKIIEPAEKSKGLLSKLFKWTKNKNK